MESLRCESYTLIQKSEIKVNTIAGGYTMITPYEAQSNESDWSINSRQRSLGGV